jgi:orotidine-5'-phosphate decarboxylase
MILDQNLTAPERVFLAVDTSDIGRARELAVIAHEAGAKVLKEGLELSSAYSWKTCSEIASGEGLDWVADAKIDDIPATTAGIVRNLVKLDHPPVGITIHTNSGIDSMRAAQEIARESGITMLAVTHLTSIDDGETKWTYGLLRNTLVRRRLNSAVLAGIGGLVCSSKELKRAVARDLNFSEMFSMIPGTRSLGADSQDQKNVTTPFQAIKEGASALVIGRQITEAKDPAQEFTNIVFEIQAGLDRVIGRK